MYSSVVDVLTSVLPYGMVAKLSPLNKEFAEKVKIELGHRNTGDGLYEHLRSLETYKEKVECLERLREDQVWLIVEKITGKKELVMPHVSPLTLNSWETDENSAFGIDHRVTNLNSIMDMFASPLDVVYDIKKEVELHATLINTINLYVDDASPLWTLDKCGFYRISTSTKSIMKSDIFGMTSMDLDQGADVDFLIGDYVIAQDVRIHDVVKCWLVIL